MRREALKELVREVLAEATQQQVEAFVADLSREWLSARFGPLGPLAETATTRRYRAARHRERPPRMDALQGAPDPRDEEEGT